MYQWIDVDNKIYDGYMIDADTSIATQLVDGDISEFTTDTFCDPVSSASPPPASAWSRRPLKQANKKPDKCLSGICVIETHAKPDK